MKSIAFVLSRVKRCSKTKLMHLQIYPRSECLVCFHAQPSGNQKRKMCLTTVL